MTWADAADPGEPRRAAVASPVALLTLLATCLALLVAAVAVVATARRGAARRRAPPRPPPTAADHHHDAPPTEVPPSTDLATPKGSIAAYDQPDGRPIGDVGFWYGYPMTMPILEEAGAALGCGS